MARLITYFAFLFIAHLVTGEIENIGWWKNTVFYQIYPRSFKDYDGDGVGDLKGITSRLEHFSVSGIGGIWLSPIYTSPMIDFGYDIANFTEVDPIFGTMEDFQAMVEKARTLGLKVILDFVPNHTSDLHPWFEKSVKRIAPYDDYYVWQNGSIDDDGTRYPPNNWISVFSGSAWTWNEERGQWYFHQFAAQQPDLNYFNEEVQEAMKDVLRFWLEKGVDGFRIDAIPHLVEVEDFADEPLSNTPGVNPNDYGYLDHIYTKDHALTYRIMEDWRKVLDDHTNSTNGEETVLMTEAYTNLTNTLKYYEYGVQIPFNFKFITGITNTSTADDFKDAIDIWMDNMPNYGVANWVMGNHDRSRTASRFPGREDQMTMLAMILPGVAVTYYGEEIGMIDTWVSWEDTQDPQACNTDETRYEAHSRDPNRSPFQWDSTTSAGFSTNSTTWLPVNANYQKLNLRLQSSTADSHYNIYLKMVLLRNQSVLREGTHDVKVIGENVLAVTRTLKEDDVTKKAILLINFDNSVERTVDLTSAEVSEKSDTASVYTSSLDYKTTTGENVDVTKVRLPAKASLVIISRSGAVHLSGSVLIMILAFVFKHLVTRSE